jgi:hypothetical protein
MANSKPVNWKEVAKRGCFVYAYLRQHDHTPYYIGIAKLAKRPLEVHHHCTLPADNSLIVLMKSGLTWEEACQWECFYISRYGRKQFGGLLLNKTDGGDGVVNVIYTEEMRARMSASAKNKTLTDEQREANRALLLQFAKQSYPFSPEHRRAISEAKKGAIFTAEHRAKISLAKTGMCHSEETKVKISQAITGRQVSAETKKRLSLIATNRPEAHKAKIKESHQRATADKYGVDQEWYLSLPPSSKRKLCWRFCEGKRGAALTAGIN